MYVGWFYLVLVWFGLVGVGVGVAFSVKIFKTATSCVYIFFSFFFLENTFLLF